MDRLGVGKRPFAATLSLQAAVGVGSMLGGAVGNMGHQSGLRGGTLVPFL